MSRIRITVAGCVVLLAISIAWAGEPTPQTQTTKAPPPQAMAPVAIPGAGTLHPGLTAGVHIVSVRLEGNCGAPSRFVVEIQNNLGKPVRSGSVYVGAPNSPGNRTGNPTAAFSNLQPGERRTLTLNARWRVPCALDELGQPTCFEVGILMEPDGTANGEIWDGVFHRVCASPPRNAAPVVTDTTHN